MRQRKKEMIDMRLRGEWMMWIRKRLGSFRNLLKFSMMQPCGFQMLIMSLAILSFWNSCQFMTQLTWSMKEIVIC